MDRPTVYYGQIVRSVDTLSLGQYTMVALAKLAEAVLGTSTLVDGFTVTPTSPASLSVILTPGTVMQVEDLEASVWSTLPADLAHTIVKQGIQLDPVTFGITPPGTIGYSQVFLVEVQYADQDTGATVLPYYNAANPTAPYSGPGNSGSAQNTVRKGVVASQIKSGTAATTGTQVAPTADAGWTGIYTITVAYGATTITAGNITKLTAAPFIPAKLPEIPAGVQSGKWLYGVDTGTANAMVTVLDPVPKALVPGMTVRVKKGASANSGATTLDIGLGSNAVKRATGADLSSGDLPGSTVAEFVWDGAYWQVANFQGFNATSTTTNNYTLDLPYAADSSGSANTIVASFSPAVTVLAAGDILKIKVANTVTGATTATVNAITGVSVVRPDGSALQAGDLVAGQEALFAYDGTKLQVNNLAGKAAQPFYQATFTMSYVSGVDTVPASLANVINTFGTSTYSAGVFTVGTGEAGLYGFELGTSSYTKPVEVTSLIQLVGGAPFFQASHSNAYSGGSSNAVGFMRLAVGDQVRFTNNINSSTSGDGTISIARLGN